MASTTSTTSTTTTTTQQKTSLSRKTYLFHSHEWLLFVFLLWVLGAIRMHLLLVRNESLSSVSPEKLSSAKAHLFEHATTMSHIKSLMTTYCGIDLGFLCGLPPEQQLDYDPEDNQDKTCNAIYGPILVNLWDMKLSVRNRKCSLKIQFASPFGSLGKIPELDFTSANGISNDDLFILSSDDNQRLERLLLYTYFALYRNLVAHESHSRPQLLDKIALDEGDRMIQVVLPVLMDFFVVSIPAEKRQRLQRRRRHLDTVQQHVEALVSAVTKTTIRGGGGGGGGGSRNSNATVSQEQRMLLSSSSSSLPTSYAVREGVLRTTYTREKFLAMMEWAARHAKGSKHYQYETTYPSYQAQFLPRVSEAIETLYSSPPLEQPSSITTSMTTFNNNGTISKNKHSYHIFQFESQEQCMYHHFDDETLITNVCNQAMKQAPQKYREIQIEIGGDFEFLSHSVAIGGNCIILFILLSLCTAQGRLEKRIERGKRRLAQELQDPFLRQVLEKKSLQQQQVTLDDEGLSTTTTTTTGVVGDQQQQLVSQLDQKAATWNTKVAALKLFRRQVRNFRYTLLFCLVALSLLFISLSMFRVASPERFLDNAIVNLMALTATYWLPMNVTDSDEEDSEKEVKAIGTKSTGTTKTTTKIRSSNSSLALQNDVSQNDEDDGDGDDDGDDNDSGNDDELVPLTSPSADQV